MRAGLMRAGQRHTSVTTPILRWFDETRLWFDETRLWFDETRLWFDETRLVVAP
jgi:hypothetical protein